MYNLHLNGLVGKVTILVGKVINLVGRVVNLVGKVMGKVALALPIIVTLPTKSITFGGHQFGGQGFGLWVEPHGHRLDP